MTVCPVGACLAAGLSQLIANYTAAVNADVAQLYQEAGLNYSGSVQLNTSLGRRLLGLGEEAGSNTQAAGECGVAVSQSDNRILLGTT